MSIKSVIQQWPADVLERSQKLYPAGMEQVALSVAMASPHAIQYLEQAPALIAFLLLGQPPSKETKSHRLLRHRLAEILEGSPRLPKVLAALGAPGPLRRIHASACVPSRMTEIYLLKHIAPMTLADVIPETAGAQKNWLRCLSLMVEDNGLFSMDGAFDHFWPWLVQAVGRDLRGRSARGEKVGKVSRHDQILQDLRAVIDLAKNVGLERIRPDWSLERAVREAKAWHDDLARRRSEQDVVRGLGVSFDHRFSYGDLPDLREVLGYEFHALRSGEELFQEGAAMRHCVATYIRDVAAGGAYIYSIRQAGERVATLELIRDSGFPIKTAAGAFCHIDGGLRMRQLAGPCNTVAPMPVRNVADAFVATLESSTGSECPVVRLHDGGAATLLGFCTPGQRLYRGMIIRCQERPRFDPMAFGDRVDMAIPVGDFHVREIAYVHPSRRKDRALAIEISANGPRPEALPDWRAVG